MGGKSSKPKIDIVRYYMAIHWGVCVNADALRRVVIKEKDAWNGYQAGAGSFVIDEDQLFGGQSKEGGIQAVVYWLPGAADQILPDELAQKLGRAGGTDAPGYRGVATAFFTGPRGTPFEDFWDDHIEGRGGAYWSVNSPYLPPVWLEVEREPIGLNPEYAFCGGLAGPSAAICIVIDKSSQVNHGTILQTEKDAIAIYLEYLKGLALGGRVMDIQLRSLYSTTWDVTYRSATAADIDALIAFVGTVSTGSVIICDWRRAAEGARDFFNATDASILDRQLLWVCNGQAGWQFMADGAAATINAITPLPTVSVFNCDDPDTSDGQQIDNTAVDGVPVFEDGESDELGAAMIGPVAQSIGPRRDANPAHIIYECLTNTDWGMGSPSTAIDVDSFNDAAVTLHGENFCLSMIWTRQSTIEDFVQEVLDHIVAVLFVDPATGLLTLKLIRADYDVEDLPDINPSNAQLSNFDRKTWGNIVNEIVVTWTNPDTEQDETVIAQDLASIVTQGIVSDGRNYYGVRNSGLAQKLAVRDLRTSGAPLASCDVEIDRSQWRLRPASVATVTWPEHGLAGVVMRVMSINYGKPGDMRIKASLLEDVFGLDAGDYVDPPTTGWTDPSTAPAAADFSQIFTLPLFFAAATNISAFVSSPEYPEVLAGVLATSSSDDTSEIELWDEVTLPDSSLQWQLLNSLSVLGHALLVDALPAEAVSTISSFASVIGATGATAGGFLIIGDGTEQETEIALVTAVGASVTVDRGVLDTVPREWPAASPVWFVDIEATIEDPIVRSAGEEVSYKLLPRTSLGLLPLASASLIEHELTERPWLPNRPADVKAYDGTAFSSLLAPIDATGRVDAWITIDWADRNRLLEETQVLSWTDATVDPEDGQTTVITVLKVDGTTVLTTHPALTGTTFDVPDASFAGESIAIIRTSSERTDADGTFASLQSFDHYVIVSSSYRATEDSIVRRTEDGDIRRTEG